MRYMRMRARGSALLIWTQMKEGSVEEIHSRPREAYIFYAQVCLGHSVSKRVLTLHYIHDIRRGQINSFDLTAS